jgi:hypothetical protein
VQNSKLEPDPARSQCRIEITPTPEEYRRLCRDLDRLREGGMATNTAAILRAVSLLAEGKISLVQS